ncbi:MAG: glycosyltransferase involved in cell wall biosynthesis [Colwellia sp.]|jgi:glycosyltransferase involved in cell wall biosynthesis
MPKKIDGVDEVEIVILDDGSNGKAIEVAKALGLHHIVINKNNRGLARTLITELN